MSKIASTTLEPIHKKSNHITAITAIIISAIFIVKKMETKGSAKVQLRPSGPPRTNNQNNDAVEYTTAFKMYVREN